MDQHEPEPPTRDQEPASPGVGPPALRRAPLKRASNRFFDNPSSGRNAIALIVTADVLIVLVGGFTIWLVDPAEYAEITTAFWYILQTITTVGYGDVTPTEPAGRLVGAIFMMLGLAFLSILTASITSSFIDARQAARREQRDSDERAHQVRLEARLDDLIERLERIERGRKDADPGAG